MSRMVTAQARPPPDDLLARADQRVTLTGVPWALYEQLDAVRGDKAVPRLSYLEGTLEIMSPSTYHERTKSRIGRLVEAYMLHHDITFEAVGSWTLKSGKKKAGAEPDECYLVGDDRSGDRPHLAIEVNWTHGGLDKLAIYARLGVGEVWIWQDDAVTVHRLVGARYEERSASEVLPGIDLAQLVRHLDADSASEAIKAYRRELEGGLAL